MAEKSQFSYEYEEEDIYGVVLVTWCENKYRLVMHKEMAKETARRCKAYPKMRAEITTLQKARQREKYTLRKKQENARQITVRIRNLRRALKIATDYLKEWRDWYKSMGKHQEHDFRDKLEEIEQALEDKPQEKGGD